MSESGSSSSESSRRRQHEVEDDDGSSHSGSHFGSDSGSNSSHSSKKSRSEGMSGDADMSHSHSGSEGSGAFISDSDDDEVEGIGDDESASSRNSEEDDRMSQSQSQSQRSGSERSERSSMSGSQGSGQSGGSAHSRSSHGSTSSGSRKSNNDDESERSGSSRRSDDDHSSRHSHSSSQEGGGDGSESRISGDGSSRSTRGSGRQSSTQAGDDEDVEDRSRVLDGGSVHSRSSLVSESQKDEGSEHSRSSKGSANSGSQASTQAGDDDGSQTSKSSAASGSHASNQSAGNDDGSQTSKSSAASGSHASNQSASQSASDDGGSQTSKFSKGSTTSGSQASKQSGSGGGHSRTSRGSATSGSAAAKQSGDNDSEHSRSSKESATSGSAASKQSGDDDSEHSRSSMGSAASGSAASKQPGDDDSEHSRSSKGSTASGSQVSNPLEVDASSSQHSRSSDGSKETIKSDQADSSSEHSSDSEASRNSSKDDRKSTSSNRDSDGGSAASKSRGSALSKSSAGSTSKEGEDSSKSGSDSGSSSTASGHISGKTSESELGLPAQSGKSRSSIPTNDGIKPREMNSELGPGVSNTTNRTTLKGATKELDISKRYTASAIQLTIASASKSEKGNDTSDIIKKGKVSSLGKIFAFKESKPSRFGDPPSVRGDPPSIHGYAKSETSSQMSTTGNSYGSKASWVSSQPTKRKDNIERQGILVTREMKDKLARRQKQLENGENADFGFKKGGNDIEQIMDRRRSQTEVMMVSATTDNAPLEHNFICEEQAYTEESKTEITNEVQVTESVQKRYKYKDKGRSTDSRSTALTAESLETARESDGGEAKLEQIAEPYAPGISEEGSISEYEEESVTEIEIEENAAGVECADEFGVASTGDFLSEIVAFAESRSALGFSWVPDEHIEIVIVNESEEPVEDEIVEDENVATEIRAPGRGNVTDVDDDDFDAGDELMGKYSSTDEYVFSEAKARESRSLVSLPVVVEFGGQDDEVQSTVLSRDDITSRTLTKYDDDELPFDEACQDNIQGQVTKEFLGAFPEYKSVYDVENGDIDSLIKLVTSYKERLQTLADERNALLLRDNTDAAKSAPTNRGNEPDTKPDAVQRTKKLLEQLRVATLSRKKGIPFEIMTTPEGKLKNLEVRKQEVLSSVHKVDWSMFRTRKTLESVKTGAESNERNIPALKAACLGLSRSQEYFSNLRQAVTTKPSAVSNVDWSMIHTSRLLEKVKVGAETEVEASKQSVPPQLEAEENSSDDHAVATNPNMMSRIVITKGNRKWKGKIGRTFEV